MPNPWRRSFVLAATLLLGASSSLAAYPDKPIRLVLASGVGGTLDTVTRAYAPRMAALLGQPVVIENKPGAGALVAIQAVLQQPADGHTLLLGSANVVMVPHMYPDAKLSVARDLLPVAPVASLPMLLVVHAALPARNLQEFIALARARPGALNFGVAAPASFDRLAGADFMGRSGIDLTVVPFKGEGQALLELLAGRTQAQMATWVTLAPHVKAGKLRVLAATTRERSAAVPDVATISEQGFPGYDAGAWFGMFARAGTPREVVARLSEVVHQIQQQADFREALRGIGLDLMHMEPEPFARMVGQENDRWGGLILRIGLKPE